MIHPTPTQTLLTTTFEPLVMQLLKWLHCNGQFGKRVSFNEVRSRP